MGGAYVSTRILRSIVGHVCIVIAGSCGDCDSLLMTK